MLRLLRGVAGAHAWYLCKSVATYRVYLPICHAHICENVPPRPSVRSRGFETFGHASNHDGIVREEGQRVREREWDLCAWASASCVLVCLCVRVCVWVSVWVSLFVRSCVCVYACMVLSFFRSLFVCLFRGCVCVCVRFVYFFFVCVCLYMFV